MVCVCVCACCVCGCRIPASTATVGKEKTLAPPSTITTPKRTVLPFLKSRTVKTSSNGQPQPQVREEGGAEVNSGHAKIGVCLEKKGQFTSVLQDMSAIDVGCACPQLLPATSLKPLVCMCVFVCMMGFNMCMLSTALHLVTSSTSWDVYSCMCFGVYACVMFAWSVVFAPSSDNMPVPDVCVCMCVYVCVCVHACVWCMCMCVCLCVCVIM